MHNFANKYWKRLILFTLFWIVFWYLTATFIPFNDKELGSGYWFIGIWALPIPLFMYGCLDWLFSQRVLKDNPGKIILILSFILIVLLSPFWVLLAGAVGFVVNLI